MFRFFIKIYLIVLVTLICCAELFVQSASSWTHGSASGPAASVVCDASTGVATGTGAGTCMTTTATCNNGDDGNAFISFQDWAVNTWQASHSGLIELVLPTGHCNLPNAIVSCLPAVATNGCPFINIKQLRITGAGATNTTLTTTDANFSFGGIGIRENNTSSVRVATVSAGSSCVSLVTAGQSSRFTANTYAMMAGIDLQGIWAGGGFGYPPNPYYYEYLFISSIDASHQCDGSTSGASVTFSTPLAYTYKSTWPSYDAGSSTGADQGGPVTLYVLYNWDTAVEFQNLTLDKAGQFYARGRSISYTNVTFTGSACAIPSENQTWTATGSDFSTCTMEVDKIIGTASLIGTTINGIHIQSSTPDVFNLTNSTVIHAVNGTPKKMVVTGSTIYTDGLAGGGWQLGATSYGRTNEIVCTNSTINKLMAVGVVDNGWDNTGITNHYTMSAGVISSPNGTTYSAAANNGSGAVRLTVVSSAGFATGKFAKLLGGSIYDGTWQITVIDGTHIDLVSSTFTATATGSVQGGSIPWAIPGTNLMFVDATNGNLPVFQVTDVTQDANFTYVATTLASGFPSGISRIQVHPAPKMTFTNCSGTDGLAAIYSQAPPNAPVFSYWTNAYVGNNGSAYGTFTMWGTITSGSFNVTNAYSGAGSLTFHLSQFDNWLQYNGSTWGNFGPSVNAKVGGSTSITSANWFGGASNSGPAYSADVSSSCPGAGCPSVTVTIQADQGVVNP